MPSTSLDSVKDVITLVNASTMDPQTVLTSGRGKAYQAVAQSAAIAVQDAADALRNVSTIATTAAGVAMAQYIATGKPQYAEALQAAQTMMTSATTDFQAVGAAAAQIVKDFPTG